MVTQLCAADAVHVYAEELGTQSKVVDVYIFDVHGARLTPADVYDWLTERIGAESAFQQRLRRVPGDLDYPYWEFDPEFDLHNHVFELPFHGIGWEALRERLCEIADGGVALHRPPWEMHLISDVIGVEGIPAGACAVVLKFHHCVGDATATVELARALFARESVASSSIATAALGMSRPRLVGRALRGAPARVARLLVGLSRQRKDARATAEATRRGEISPVQRVWPVTRFNRELASGPTMERLRFDLSAVDVIRRAVPGATVNDVAMSVIAGALRAYLEEVNERPDKPLGARVPRSIRPLQYSSAGNQFAVMSVNLHTDIADPVLRLHEVHRSAQSEKRRLAHPAVLRMESMLGRVPAPYLRAAMKADVRATMAVQDAVPGGNTLISNVARGDGTGMSLCGADLVDAFGVLPVANRAGVSHFVASMAGCLTIIVTAAQAMMPDSGRYAELLRDSFDALLRGVSGNDELTFQSA